MIVHVDSVHVAAHEIPGRSWLLAHNKWVCGHCLALHSTRRPGFSAQCFKVPPGELASVWQADQPTVVEGNLLPGPARAPRATTMIMGTSMSLPCPKRATLIDIFSTHRPLLRHIPKAAMAQWTAALVDALDTFRRHRTWESLGALLAFPKVTLEPPTRGGRCHKDEVGRVVKARVARFVDGGWEAQWQEVRGIRAAERFTKKRRKEPVDKEKRLSQGAFLASLQGFMEDGAFSKAVKHLVSEGLHDSLDEGVRAELRRLHPVENPVIHCADGKPWPQVQTPDERRAMPGFLQLKYFKNFNGPFSRSRRQKSAMLPYIYLEKFKIFQILHMVTYHFFDTGAEFYQFFTF